jgi:hypothetical protein
MAIKHRFTSAKADGADNSLVQPGDWNDDHKFDHHVAVAAPGAGSTITNVGTTYDAVALSQNLGFIEVVMDGIDTIVFTVRVNKVGAGTQDWQLWNDTDSTQVGVISDAGAAGLKYLSTTITGLALTGTKRLRIRAKSSTAADDPVYYGTSLILRKTA